MHECQRYNGLVMRGLYRPSYHFITTLIGAARGSLIYVDTTLGGGPVARLFGWDRGPIWDWVGPWPDLGGLVARFGWARGPIWDDVSQDSCVPPCAYSHRGGSGTETDVTGASPRQDRSFRALLDRNTRDSTRSNAKYH